MVPEPETGSVAIKTKPNAKLPMTKCQYQGIANIGLVSEPTIFNIPDINIIPSMVATTILQEATFEARRIINPMPIAIIDVSPMEPGIYPRNASIQVKF